jgi:hypothetical protein
VEPLITLHLQVLHRPVLQLYGIKTFAIAAASKIVTPGGDSKLLPDVNVTITILGAPNYYSNYAAWIASPLSRSNSELCSSPFGYRRKLYKILRTALAEATSCPRRVEASIERVSDLPDHDKVVG